MQGVSKYYHDGNYRKHLGNNYNEVFNKNKKIQKSSILHEAR